MHLRIIYTLLLLAAVHFSKAILVTFTITDAGSGNPTSADVILSQAETQANAGNNVIVYMNAPGFCAPNIVLSLTSGSLTIQKMPGAAVPQGFEPAANSPNAPWTLVISCQSSLTAVSIMSVTIKSRIGGVRLTGGGAFLGDNITFTSYQQAIFFEDQLGANAHVIGDVLIQNCVFSGRLAPTIWNDPMSRTICRRNYAKAVSPAKVFKILNNTFKALPTANGLVYLEDLIEVSTYMTTDNLSIEIKNNSSPQPQGSFALKVGASIISGTYQNNDYLFSLDVQNNTQMTHLFLDRPLNYWKIQTNTISPSPSHLSQAGIIVTPGYPGGLSPSLYTVQKLGFINSTSVTCANQTFINSNNTFTTPTTMPNMSYAPPRWWGAISGNKSPGCALTEILDINSISGSVQIYENVLVRRCRITGTQPLTQLNGLTNQPIVHVNSPLSATLNLTSISSGSLMASYSYTGITNATNNDLYIDFYKSNTNGDLLDYIGQKLVAVGSITGSGSAAILIPGTVTLSPSDRVAMTLTGVNPNPALNPTVVALGTSNAFYPSDLTPCGPGIISAPLIACSYPNGVPVSAVLCANTQATYSWNVYSGSSLTGYIFTSPTFTIPSTLIGIWTIKLTVSYPGQAAPQVTYQNIELNHDCMPAQVFTPCITPSPTMTVANPQATYCVGQPITFNFIGSFSTSNNDVDINMGECQWYDLFHEDGPTISRTVVHTYNQPGTYIVQTKSAYNSNCIYSMNYITIVDCDDNSNVAAPDLPDCQANFKPPPGDYILSFWVREEYANYNLTTTYASGIDVTYNTSSTPVIVSVYADDPSNSGNRLIDKWQKVEKKVTIPASALDFNLDLVNRAFGGANAYFDDIRFHPVNSTFKSYVYDPVTLRLSAELDERNYATLYEYDEEGQLVRVKKETERGIKTIKESRTGVSK